MWGRIKKKKKRKKEEGEEKKKGEEIEEGEHFSWRPFGQKNLSIGSAFNHEGGSF